MGSNGVRNAPETNMMARISSPLLMMMTLRFFRLAMESPRGSGKPEAIEIATSVAGGEMLASVRLRNIAQDYPVAVSGMS